MNITTVGIDLAKNVFSVPIVEVTGAARLYRAASVWTAELGIDGAYRSCGFARLR